MLYQLSRYWLSVGGLLAPLAGCTVYMPTVPGTPLLTKGQTQVSGGLRNLTSLEAGVAWAPTRHLLLSAESALKGIGGDSYHRQLGLGVGYYAASATSRTYLAVLAGAGVANTSQLDATLYLSLGLSPSVGGATYRASYWRYYGQAYIASSLSSKMMGGLSLRTTYVNYHRLTVNDTPFTPDNHVFLEPTLFVKGGNGPLQVQGTLGLSVPTRSTDNQPGSSTTPISSLVGVALIFRPDLLKHKQQ